jgi:hypothetical protein
MDSQQRIMYKRIKDIFDYTASSSSMIELTPKKKEEIEPEKDKEGIGKKILKKVLSKIVAGE